MGCNGHKQAAQNSIDPVSGERVRLYHPREDTWANHFGWSDDCTLLVGLTPVGRATIDRLQLNRRGVVNLRRALTRLELHPPDRLQQGE